jgi:hypothetical protein
MSWLDWPLGVCSYETEFQFFLECILVCCSINAFIHQKKKIYIYIYIYIERERERERERESTLGVSNKL